MTVEWVVFLVLGAFAGFVSGLFGVGGGTVMVPALVFVLLGLGVDAAVVMQVAVGTSFALICFNSVSSARQHSKRNAVNWQVAKWAAPSLILGVTIGSFAASEVNSRWLILLFAAFLLLVAAQMASNWSPRRHASKDSSAFSLGGATSTFGFGWLSSLFGIGGGALMVPWLNYRGLTAHESVGTAAACGVPIALSGTLSYGYFGYGEVANLSYSLGFIYFPAVLGMLLTSTLTVPLGVALAHRFNPSKLKKSFAAYLVFVVAALLGVV
jgi:hypothetical protein